MPDDIDAPYGLSEGDFARMAAAVRKSEGLPPRRDGQDLTRGESAQAPLQWVKTTSTTLTTVNLINGGTLQAYPAVWSFYDSIAAAWTDTVNATWLIAANGEIPLNNTRYLARCVGQDVNAVNIWMMEAQGGQLIIALDKTGTQVGSPNNIAAIEADAGNFLVWNYLGSGKFQYNLNPATQPASLVTYSSGNAIWATPNINNATPTTHNVTGADFGTALWFSAAISTTAALNLAAVAQGFYLWVVNLAGSCPVTINAPGGGTLSVQGASGAYSLPAGAMVFLFADNLTGGNSWHGWRVENPFGTSSGGTLDVTDGTTSVNPCTEIDFTSGATVTNAGGGVANVAVSGPTGTGGQSTLGASFNVTSTMTDIGATIHVGIPHAGTFVLMAQVNGSISQTGTSGQLQVQIFDSTNSVVVGTTGSIATVQVTGITILGTCTLATQYVAIGSATLTIRAAFIGTSVSATINTATFAWFQRS